MPLVTSATKTKLAVQTPRFVPSPDRHIDSLLSYSRPANIYEDIHGPSAITSHTVQSGYSQFHTMAFGFTGILPHGHLRSDTIEVELENNDLWEKFHEIGTEMIITKTGR